MKRVLTSAEAIAYAVKGIEPAVISAYPITPQTHIIEKLAYFIEKGELKSQFVRVEAEISAIAVAAGSVAQGVRAFTATSSQGLVYMHEMLHWCAGGRLPVVMAVANRALGAPWNIWCDQQDMLSQRDTGWMMVFAKNAQEAHDLIPIAYRVSEKVFLPAMVGFDGFILSHTAEPVEIVERERIKEFLPPLDFPLRLSHHDPFTLWPILEPNLYHRQRHELFLDHESAIKVWEEAFTHWYHITNRRYSAVEGSFLEDAEEAFVVTGAIAETTTYAVKRMRREGIKVGVINLRVFRPFPQHQLREMIAHLKRIVVLDRAVSWGTEGVVSQEIRSVVAGACPVQCCIISMGGKEVYPEDIEVIYRKSARFPEGVTIWS